MIVAQSNSDTERRGPIRVLIGEADERSADAIERALGQPTVDLHRAHDTDEAVRIVSTVPIDLYFIDINFPSLGGIATIELIRQIRFPVRCVLTLEVASKESLIEAAEAEAYTHIRKPIDAGEVQFVLRRFLMRFRRQDHE